MSGIGDADLEVQGFRLHEREEDASSGDNQMNEARKTQLTSDELKAQRRRNALRWAQRPNFSLGMVMKAVFAVAIWLGILRNSNSLLVSALITVAGLSLAYFCLLCTIGHDSSSKSNADD